MHQPYSARRKASAPVAMAAWTFFAVAREGKKEWILEGDLMNEWDQKRQGTHLLQQADRTRRRVRVEGRLLLIPSHPFADLRTTDDPKVPQRPHQGNHRATHDEVGRIRLRHTAHHLVNRHRWIGEMKSLHHMGGGKNKSGNRNCKWTHRSSHRLGRSRRGHGGSACRRDGREGSDEASRRHHREQPTTKVGQ